MNEWETNETKQNENMLMMMMLMRDKHTQHTLQIQSRLHSHLIAAALACTFLSLVSHTAVKLMYSKLVHTPAHICNIFTSK